MPKRKPWFHKNPALHREVNALLDDTCEHCRCCQPKGFCCWCEGDQESTMERMADFEGEL